MAEPWIEPDLWERAAEPRPGAVVIGVAVMDPELGTIAVCRAPDGREAYGADSPR